MWRRGVAASQPMNLDRAEEVREEVLTQLRQSPRESGFERTRWRLQDLLTVIRDTLAVNRVSSLWHVLQRLGIRFRQGWEHQVSPDPLATEKLQVIDHVLQQAAARPDEVVVVWLDELTVYRLPSPGPVWCSGEGRAAKAVQSPGSNTQLRIAGALNPITGQVDVMLRSKIGKVQLRLFYQQLRQAYPDARELYVIQDCWPVHFLPEVCQAAVQQGITMVPLPTNPIEKLWRWLKQTVVHMHPWADQWSRFKVAVQDFLSQFQRPNSAVLHYVGLSN